VAGDSAVRVREERISWYFVLTFEGNFRTAVSFLRRQEWPSCSVCNSGGWHRGGRRGFLLLLPGFDLSLFICELELSDS
jgi:hypothetical protein